MQRYEQALISTGNTVGLTSSQLSDLANRVGDATDAYGDAETATAALAASGKVTGAALEDASRAAVALARLTGDSIEDTTAKIIKLATSPTKVMEELNSQYHFLTVSIYDQVTALEKQGRTQEAAQVAIEAFANVHEQRVREAEERAGSLEKAWRAVRNSIAAAWDGLKEVGKDNTQADLRAAQAQLDFLKASQIGRAHV